MQNDDEKKLNWNWKRKYLYAIYPFITGGRYFAKIDQNLAGGNSPKCDQNLQKILHPKS